MKDKYIVNPKTDRVVLIRGKIGQEILNSHSKEEINKLMDIFKQKENKRLKNAKCEYGDIYTTVGGRKCVKRKTKEGKEAVKCQQEITRAMLKDFEEGALDISKVKTRKQALAMSLKSSQTKC